MDMHIVHRAVYNIARVFVWPTVKLKYSFTTDKIPKLEEPFIMLSNHTTEADMLFAGLAGRHHMYFVCGEHLLRNRQYGKLLKALVDPIPVPKGGASLEAVRRILKRAQAGYNICMFPEGKRSFHGETIPSPVSLGKLVKKSGCALVTYRIRGGYFTYPRWARNHHRKGHVEGKVMGIYSSAQLREMTAQEITDIINRDTYENAYEVQRLKQWTYTGKDKAKGLEHILFICPRCNGMDTISTEGDGFTCSSCGLHGAYNDHGYFEGDDLPFDNVLSWMRWIEPVFDSFAAKHKDGDLLFTEENVLLYQMLDGYKNVDIGTSALRVFKDRMVIGGEWISGDPERGEFEFPFSEISGMSMLFGNILLFTYKGSYYGLTGDTFHAWKCCRLWHLSVGDTGDRTKEI